MKTKFSNHEAVRIQFMTQCVNSLLSGENCLKQHKSTYDKRFIRYHKCFLLKLRYGAHANSSKVFLLFIEFLLKRGKDLGNSAKSLVNLIEVTAATHSAVGTSAALTAGDSGDLLKDVTRVSACLHSI